MIQAGWLWIGAVVALVAALLVTYSRARRSEPTSGHLLQALSAAAGALTSLAAAQQFNWPVWLTLAAVLPLHLTILMSLLTIVQPFFSRWPKPPTPFNPRGSPTPDVVDLRRGLRPLSSPRPFARVAWSGVAGALVFAVLLGGGLLLYGSLVGTHAARYSPMMPAIWCGQALCLIVLFVIRHRLR